MATSGHSGEQEWREGAVPDRSLAQRVTIDDVRAAAGRLAGHTRKTPVMTSRTLDGIAGASVFLKCENFQRVGAFKFRGACNALMKLNEEQKRRGVVTFSSGNHAQGLALAAAVVGVSAKIVMPTNAPAVKLAATRQYLAGAPEPSAVVEFDPDEAVREVLGREIAENEGREIIPPYDHTDVIAGQGTAALELFEEVGELDRLYVCCGGGGLLSGCATVATAVSPGCEVIGVEPEAGDDATRSFAAGRLCTVRNPDTIADGARTPYTGRHTLAIILERVDRMMTVSDAELARDVLFCMERMKLVIEPSGVLGLAGLRRDAAGGSMAGQRVGVIVSGGNLDLGLVGMLGQMAATQDAGRA